MVIVLTPEGPRTVPTRTFTTAMVAAVAVTLALSMLGFRATRADPAPDVPTAGVGTRTKVESVPSEATAKPNIVVVMACLLYTSDAADE